jgi:hypothetical protein
MRKSGMDQDLRELLPVKKGDATAAPAPPPPAARRIDRPMKHWFDEARDQHEFVQVRRVWVTIAVSLLVHAAALLFVLQDTRLLAPADEGDELAKDRLQVRLAAIPRPVPVPAPEPAREVLLAKPPPRATTPPQRKSPPPVVLAAPATAPAFPTPSVPAPPVPAPPRPSPPINSDMWSYMQARRRERGEPAGADAANPPADLNASLAANLPAAATGAATQRDKQRGGGVFEVTRVTYDDAAFLFYGWNKDMGRRTPQLIEVRKGANIDMCIAVVRRMIAIIREHEQGDFFWQSNRRDHDVVLSARLADNAALEDFLKHDFGASLQCS